DGESALAVRHRDPLVSKRLEAWEQANPPTQEDSGVVSGALFDGRSELLAEVQPDLAQREGKDAEHAELLRALDTRSRICVPIRARNRVLGALVVGATSGGRRYTATDLALAEDIAVRIGQAIDNAHLYEDAVHASEAK